MTVPLGAALPASRLAQLGPAASPDRALVVPLCTMDDDGFPHVALLGTWEVVALDRGTLRIAVGAGSRSARHLRRDGVLHDIAASIDSQHENTRKAVRAELSEP